MILAIAEVAGSPEQVFHALTTNEVEEWWTFLGVYRLKDWKADLRIGGRWSVTVELNDGNVAHHWGEFCELDLPDKIVMTSRSDAHPLLGERETTITYRLEPIAGGTRLTVREEGFIGRAEAAYGNAENWERVLGWLAAYMGARHRVNPEPKIVSEATWLAARKKLLAKEKAFNRLRDDLTEMRRRLPMVKVEKEYVFDGPHGPVTLRDLFEGRRQLIVYHFMFDPDSDQGCKHCSCVMDNIAGGLIHLTARETSFAAVSRAPIAKIEAFKRRMQWTFPWVSSLRNDFNYDYHVTLDPDRGASVHNYKTVNIAGEMPGLSVFFRDNDLILHSYSTYLRGLDMFLSMYHLLDVTPLGRQEEAGNSMAAGEGSWIRYHDSYGIDESDSD
jgi:predicted dithiol-disulfide oxidoreductase (DUF899 family)